MSCFLTVKIFQSMNGMSVSRMEKLKNLNESETACGIHRAIDLHRLAESLRPIEFAAIGRLTAWMTEIVNASISLAQVLAGYSSRSSAIESKKDPPVSVPTAVLPLLMHRLCREKTRRAATWAHVIFAHARAFRRTARESRFEMLESAKVWRTQVSRMPPQASDKSPRGAIRERRVDNSANFAPRTRSWAISHSQTTMTRQPRERSSAILRRSRDLFWRIFGTQ
jgi:hypothetical protein